jgi:hypothetical protein
MRLTTRFQLSSQAGKSGIFALALCIGSAFNLVQAQTSVTRSATPATTTTQSTTSPSPTTVLKPITELPPVEVAPALEWQPDYTTATQLGAATKKMVLVVFSDANAERSTIPAIEKQLADPKNAKAVANHVLVKVPTNATITMNGRESRLLSHPSFSELHGGPGLAVIDYANAGTAHHKLVVSQLPFASGKYYRFSPSYLPTVLTLPAGTLTQRSMIYAVRVHPEAPQSCCGVNNPVLAAAATSHSQHQANIGVQGHHNWDSRFQQLRGQLSQFGAHGMPREVVAESWPHQSLLDSCADCVQSWRHSEGHWGAVSAPQGHYAYDIRRGNNGIWYGTGIFSN